MANADPHDEAAKKGDPEIGAAEWLFREEGPSRSPKPAGAATNTGDPEGDVFDLADGPGEVAEDEPPVPPPIPSQRAQPRERTTSSAARIVANGGITVEPGRDARTRGRR